MFKKITILFYGLAGCALAVLPKLLVCPRMPESEPMICWHTAQAETFVGVALLLVSFVLFVVKNKKNVLASSFAGILSGITGLLLPLSIGACNDPMMACHTTGYPTIYLISITIITFATANSINLVNKYHVKNRVIQSKS